MYLLHRNCTVLERKCSVFSRVFTNLYRDVLTGCLQGWGVGGSGRRKVGVGGGCVGVVEVGGGGRGGGGRGSMLKGPGGTDRPWFSPSPAPARHRCGAMEGGPPRHRLFE